MALIFCIFSPIRQIESNGGNYGCGTIVGDGSCPSGCNWDTNSCSCGPYQIKEIYFTDCSEFHSVPINGTVPKLNQQVTMLLFQ